MKKIVLSVGDKFSRLTVVSDTTEQGKYKCACECGEVRWVYAYALKNGNTKSCGCLKNEVAGNRFRRHGMAGTREYNSWASMIQRCSNENHPDFSEYGGRGITVCQEWRESFEVFYKDMGPRPEGMTLERIRIDGEYSSSNCIWADETTQNYHQRKRKDNTSGETGVYYREDGNYWLAKLWKGGEEVHNSKHHSFEEASKARKEAELEHYGYEKNI